MTKYDDASWHYGGDYPEDLPAKCGATHIGMFLAWCIIRDLISEELKEEASEQIELVKNGRWTGGVFLMNSCDGKLIDADLNKLGNAFAKDYYLDDKDFGQQYAVFIDDYLDVFDQKAEARGMEYTTLYHVEDSQENFNLIKVVIDRRFEEWKEYREG